MPAWMLLLPLKSMASKYALPDLPVQLHLHLPIQMSAATSMPAISMTVSACTLLLPSAAPSLSCSLLPQRIWQLRHCGQSHQVELGSWYAATYHVPAQGQTVAQGPAEQDSLSSHCQHAHVASAACVR